MADLNVSTLAGLKFNYSNSISMKWHVSPLLPAPWTCNNINLWYVTYHYNNNKLFTVTSTSYSLVICTPVVTLTCRLDSCLCRFPISSSFILASRARDLSWSNIFWSVSDFLLKESLSACRHTWQTRPVRSKYTVTGHTKFLQPVLYQPDRLSSYKLRQSVRNVLLQYT